MIYFIAIAIWPLINYIDLNLEKISEPNDLLVIAVSATILSMALYFLLKKCFKKNAENALLPFAILVFLFFGYGTVIDKIGAFSSTWNIRASYIWVLLVFVAVYIAFKLSTFIKEKSIIKIMIVTVFSISSANLGLNIWKKNSANTEKSVATHLNLAEQASAMDNKLHFNFKHKPNIYYILVDAYARQDTLKELADFDNEDFLKTLEDKDFSVSREAYSNYHFTGASLSATMNLFYHQVDDKGVVPYEQMHDSLKGKNLVRNIFKENDYKIVNIPAHWHQISCYGHEDLCLKKRNFEVYESYFRETPLRKFQFKNHYLDFDDIIQASTVLKDSPKFIFAHVAQIHDAVYDESGTLLPPLHPIFSGVLDAKRYVSSIKVTNDALLNLIDVLTKQDPTAIIVIQADHGPTYVGNMVPADPSYWLKNINDLRLQKKEEVKYTFGIFSAVYIPKINDRSIQLREYFSKKYSSINTFRAIFSYLADSDMKVLPDKSHFLYYDKVVLGYRESKDVVCTQE